MVTVECAFKKEPEKASYSQSSNLLHASTPKPEKIASSKTNFHDLEIKTTSFSTPFDSLFCLIIYTTKGLFLDYVLVYNIISQCLWMRDFKTSVFFFLLNNLNSVLGSEKQFLIFHKAQERITLLFPLPK